MFKLAILGDLRLVTQVLSDSFRDRLGFQFTMHPVSTLHSLSLFHFNDMVPEDVDMLVLGCLSTLLSDVPVVKTEKRDVSLSRFLLPGSFVVWAPYIIFFLLSRAFHGGFGTDPPQNFG